MFYKSSKKSGQKMFYISFYSLMRLMPEHRPRVRMRKKKFINDWVTIDGKQKKIDYCTVTGEFSHDPSRYWYT